MGGIRGGFVRKTTLYLPTDLERRLTAEAGRTGRPRAEIVRAALEEHLPPAPERPRLIGAGAGPVAPGVDSTNAKSWARGRMAERIAERRGDEGR
jgi:hypothetical protein